ncbi:TAXI family TRAP transporter solute-binding subunit [Tropicimonas marinistellae]|uniref:TAXI family TRAP transporter solute-binding subunit n=1 Tax=Tropicimonas marinistellae TaxID=1739787 RepID=UPI00083198BD|nr:TAXI family TRAP transporter solute-binding subunit [Tropicimonas marinistellae]
MRLILVLTAIVAAVLYSLYLLRDLPPPDRLSFAAGERDGGYWEIAERYREILARDGIIVDIVETAGSVENVALLADRAVDVGLVQGGIEPQRDTGVVALGTVFVEPILAFARADRPIPANPALWRGLVVARGGPGSGTQLALDRLLTTLEIGEPVNRLSDLGGQAAAEALLAGEIDVALFVAPIHAPYLVPLIQSPTTDLLVLSYADAIAQRMPHSRVLTAPAGAVSLDPVVPEVPLSTVVLLARLAGTTDLHPAVVDRMVLAAREIHGEQSVFARQGQYPTPEGADMPVDAAAQKLLTEGQSFFHDWLPYWIAAQVRRVMLILLPLLFVVVPLIRSLPAVYRWTMRRRVWQHYRAIGAIETDLAQAETLDDLRSLDGRLDALDHRLAAMRLPPAFRVGAYHARLHVDLVRRQLAERRDHLSASDP